MDVIILAGGLGTRLRSVINSLPKPMAPVADRPFLEYLLDYLISQKITNKFLVSVGYEHQKIIDHFGDNYKEYELTYLIEDTPLGTGGAIQLALNKIQTEQALIVNGDTLFNVNLSALINLHSQKKSLMTVALKPLTDFDRYNNVLLDDDQKIIGFESKKEGSWRKTESLPASTEGGCKSHIQLTPPKVSTSTYSRKSKTEYDCPRDSHPPTFLRY